MELMMNHSRRRKGLIWHISKAKVLPNITILCENRYYRPPEIVRNIPTTKATIRGGASPFNFLTGGRVTPPPPASAPMSAVFEVTESALTKKKTDGRAGDKDISASVG